MKNILDQVSHTWPNDVGAISTSTQSSCITFEFVVIGGPLTKERTAIDVLDAFEADMNRFT